MELNREEIIKAMECCIITEIWSDCKDLGCPAYRKQGCHFYLRTDDDYENTIYIEMLKDALTLIKELIEENERLNERLGREARCQYDLCGQIVNLRDDVKYIKADTVRQIQLKMAMHYGTYTDKDMTPITEVFKVLDQIAKEILEG